MRFVLVIIFFLSAFVAKGQTPTFTFQCVCDYLTAADTNCDICNTTTQSRFFKGLLIYKNGVAHKWIEQPYTIIQNFDALTFRELIPGAEQIRIELLGTAFDSIEQFRDSVMCPCAATSTGTTLIAGPGINIWNDTIASIPQQVDTFDLVSGTADTIRLSLTRDSVPFHFVILPPDSDNQYIDTLRLTGTTLEISLFGDNQPLKTVDLSSLVADGDETIVTAGTGISVSGIGTAGNPYVITNTGDLSATNEGVLGVSAGGSNDALLTSNTSGANGVTYAGGSGITISESTSSNGGTITITNAGDLSITNEIQTYGHSGTTTYTNTLSMGGGSFSITGAGINIVSQTAGAVTITGTEVDGSITNEGILGVGAGGATSSTLVSNTSGANAVTINAAGILSISESTSSNGGSITLTATEVDGSTTNELQTLANTSDATSHTVTLSNSGGSVQLIEGSGISLTTGGTGLNGTLTVANTGDLSATNEAWTIDADDADTELITTQTVKFQGGGITVTDYIPGTDILTITSTEVDGSVTNEAWTIDATGGDTEAISNQTVLFSGAGIVTTSYSSGANTLTITGTEVDGSTSNEIQALTAGGAGPTSYTLDLSLGGGSVTLTESGIVDLSRSGNTITVSATEVDGSTTNELQTLSNTSDATSHTVTLSNSGGSVKIVEGSGITIATTGTALDGIATITATDASSTNEIQSISASGAGPTSYNIDLSLSGGSVTLSEGTGINLTRSGNDITIASTITDTDDQGLTIEGSGPTYDIAIDNGTDVTIAGGGIVTLSESPANTLVITATEVDGSVTNEAWTVDADAGDTEVISNQTLLFSGAGIITTSYNAAGNTVTITGTEVDGSTTNELQTYGHSGTTSYTNTLSSGGGSFTLQSSGIVTLSHTGGTTTIGAIEVDGSVTNEAWTIDADDADTELISNQTVKFEGAGSITTDYNPGTNTLVIDGSGIVNGNGIYGDGTTGSGNDALPPGGSVVTIPGQWQPLQFNANTSGGQVWSALVVNAATCSDDRLTKYLVGKTPYDSLEIYNYDCGVIIKETGGTMTIETNRELWGIADSFNLTTIPTRTVLPYLVGQTAGGWLQKLEGTTTGQVPVWDEPNGWWELGTAGSGTVTGTGAANQATFWTSSTAISGENNFWWDSTNDRLGIGTNAGTVSSRVDVTTNSLGTSQTTTSGLALVNTTAAANGAQQISPALRWSGAGWKTNATAASQAVEFRAYATPVQGTSAPTGYLGFGAAINGSWTNDQINFSNTGEVGINHTTFTGAGLVGKLNINAGTGTAPFVFNTYGAASSAGGLVVGQISNTLNTSSVVLSLNEESNQNTLRAGLQKYGSAHASRANELNLVVYGSGAVTLSTNSTVRFTAAADGTVFSANKLAGGFASTSGIHSTVQSAGSFAGAHLETVGSPTFDDTKWIVTYTGTSNVSWTLPTASTCTGRMYYLFHRNNAGTITLSSSVNKGNGGNFNTITAGQLAIIWSTGSAWNGIKVTSL